MSNLISFSRFPDHLCQTKGGIPFGRMDVKANYNLGPLWKEKKVNQFCYSSESIFYYLEHFFFPVKERDMQILTLKYLVIAKL